MPAAKQVGGCQVTALLVVEAHLVAIQALNKTVNHHVGHRQLFQHGGQLVARSQLVRYHYEQPVDAAVDQQAHELGVV